MDRTRARHAFAESTGISNGGRGTPFGSRARFRFEVMPTEEALEQAVHLPEGATVAVSASPTKGIEATLALGEELSGRGFRVVPHLAARLVEGETHLRGILHRLDAAGMRGVFVVGGDAKEPAGPYADSLELLLAMAELGHGFEQVGIAGYPEGHPSIADDALRRALLDKAPLATCIVTQMCFAPGKILDWVAGIRRAGIELPVYAGIPGAVERRKLARISLKIGVGDSARFLAKYTDLVASLLKSRVYKPDDLIEGLWPRASVTGITTLPDCTYIRSIRWRALRSGAGARWASKGWRVSSRRKRGRTGHSSTGEHEQYGRCPGGFVQQT